jgi:hypothetical protein
VAGYITHTRSLQGSFILRGWQSPLSIRVAIDNAAPTDAVSTQEGQVVRWKVPLPSRFSNPSSWNMGSIHTAQVSVTDSLNRTLYSQSGRFRMGSLQDGNGDGYPDIVVGAWKADVSTTDDGRSFYFQSRNGAFDENNYSSITDPNGETGQTFGVRSHFVGDLNGDGYGDIGFSAHVSDVVGANRGGVFIAYGSSDGPQFQSMARVNCAGCVNATAFGFGLTAGGDINNDGYDDLVVGSLAGSRSLSVFLGGSTGIAPSPDQTISYPTADSGPAFGFSMRILPDVSGDGYPDLLVGSISADDAGPVDSGTSHLYLGSSSGLSIVPSATYFEGVPAAGNRFGRVGWLGDTNGDGIDDYFVSSLFDSTAGLVSIFLGAGIPTPPSAASVSLTHPTGQSSGLFGHDGTSVGDINGDGLSDFALSSPGDAAISNSGEVHIYLGQNQAVPQFARHLSLGYPRQDTAARFGRQVCPLDLDSDGLLDLVVSADYADIKHTDAGALFLIPRTYSQFDVQSASVINYPGSDSLSTFGQSVCGSN